MTPYDVVYLCQHLFRYWLTAPTHYLSQYWIFIWVVLWHSFESNFPLNAYNIILYDEFEIYILNTTATSPRANEKCQYASPGLCVKAVLISIVFFLREICRTPKKYAYGLRFAWRHQMETFSALLAIYVGNSQASGEFPAQRPVTRSFEVFFDLRLNKRLRKQPWGWWFETLSCTLWRHCNVVCHCGEERNDFILILRDYSLGQSFYTPFTKTLSPLWNRSEWDN